MAALTRTLALSAPATAAASSSRLQRPSQTASFGANVRLAGPHRAAGARRLAPVAAATTAVDLDKLVSDIKGLTLEQARTLTDRLQEELGVSASAMMPMGGAVAAPGGTPAEAAPVVEEKTEFDLFLDEVPANARISVIKVIRTLTSLGLKEAKDLIEGLPKKIKEAVAKEDADEAQKALEAVGAKCTIK